MTMTDELISKFESLSETDMTTVLGLVDQLSKKPIDFFEDLRRNGIENPMTEDDIDNLVSSVRSERRASGS